MSLFLSFFKIGAFTFGGGYAMIALLQDEFVAKKEFLSPQEFLDIISVAESTPGPIAVNSATFIGYKKAGFLGSLVSTVAVCLPSFTVIYIISLFFDRFLQIPCVDFAFKGIRVCVVYLIFSAGIKMFASLKKDVFTRAVFFAVLVVFTLLSLFAVRFSSIFYILICGTSGLVLYGVRSLKGGKGK